MTRNATGQYIPQEPAHLLNVFVETWFGPDGRGGDKSTWRCGFMASILSYLMSAHNIKHEIVKGKCQDIDHVWIRTENPSFDGENNRYTVYDPAVQQFDMKEDTFPIYITEDIIQPNKFEPMVFGNPDGPVLSIFNIKRIHNPIDSKVQFDFWVSDDHPPLVFLLPDDKARELWHMLSKVYETKDAPVTEFVPPSDVTAEPKAGGDDYEDVMPGTVWQHYKGGIYTVIDVLNAENDDSDDNNPPMVYYIGADGRPYGRLLNKWLASFRKLTIKGSVWVKDEPAKAAEPNEKPMDLERLIRQQVNDALVKETKPGGLLAK